jgi:predicted DNA-binding transcriptional regulator AlpA
MSDLYENLRVVTTDQAAEIAGVSPRTWARLKSQKLTPPITHISQRRVGYRIADLREWLDRRREKALA